MTKPEPTLYELNSQIAEVSNTINNIVADDFNYSEALLRQVHLEKCLEDCLKAQALLDSDGAKVSEFYRKTTHDYKSEPQRYAKELRALYNKVKSHNDMRAALSESSPKRANEFEIPHAIEIPKATWERPAYQRSSTAILVARFKNYSTQKYHKRAHITVRGAKRHLASLQSVFTEMNGEEDQRKKRWDVLAANEDAVEAGLAMAYEKLYQEANHAIWLDAYEGYVAYLRRVFQDLEKEGETLSSQSLRPRRSFWRRNDKSLGTKASLLSLSKLEKRTPLKETTEDRDISEVPLLSQYDTHTQFKKNGSPLPADITEMMRMKSRAAPTIRSIDDFRASQPPLAAPATWHHAPPMNAFTTLPNSQNEANRGIIPPRLGHLSPFPPAKETTGSLTRRRRNGFEKSHRSFEGYTEHEDDSSVSYTDARKNCLSPREYYDQMFAGESLAHPTPHAFAKDSRLLSDPVSSPPSVNLNITKQRVAPTSSVYSPLGSEDGGSEREQLVYKKPKAHYDNCFRPAEKTINFSHGYDDDSDGLAARALYSDVENYSDEMSPLGQANTPNTPIDSDFYGTAPMTKSDVYACGTLYSPESQDCIASVAPLRLPSQTPLVHSL